MGTSEGIALEVLRSLGVISPVDSRQICEACGVSVRRWGHAFGARAGDAIWYPSRASLEQRQWIVAHELGHWLLDDYGLDPADEVRADRIAAALLMPRRTFRHARVSALAQLAQDHAVSQTAAAMRFGECDAVEAAYVLASDRVYARIAKAPPEGRLREMMTIEITDAQDRVALFAV